MIHGYLPVVLGFKHVNPGSSVTLFHIELTLACGQLSNEAITYLA